MNRILWIDNWKGFMLLAICIGHFHFPIPYFNLIEPLHVASFYFLSGLLFNEGKYGSVKELVYSKFWSLLFPFFALSLFFLILTPKLYELSPMMYVPAYGFIGGGGNPFASNTDYLLHELRSLCFGSGSVSATGPLWFVKNLFLVEIFIYLAIRLNRVYSFLLAYGFIGYLLYLYDIHLFWGIDIVFTGAAIALYGYTMRSVLQKLLHNNYLAVGALAGCGILYIIGLNVGGTIVPVVNRLCQPWYGYIMVVSFGLIMWYVFFRIFSEITIFTSLFRLFGFLSRNSIAILAGHYYGGQLCRTFFSEDMCTPWFPYMQLLLAIIVCACLIPAYNRFMPALKGILQG